MFDLEVFIDQAGNGHVAHIKFQNTLIWTSEVHANMADARQAAKDKMLEVFQAIFNAG